MNMYRRADVMNTANAAGPIKITGLACAHCFTMDSLSRPAGGEHVIHGAPAKCSAYGEFTAALGSVTAKMGDRLNLGKCKATNTNLSESCCSPLEVFIPIDVDTYGPIEYDGKAWTFPNVALTEDQRQRLKFARDSQRIVRLSVLWLSDLTAYESFGRAESGIGFYRVVETEIIRQNGTRDRLFYSKAEAITEKLRELNREYGSTGRLLTTSTALRGYIRVGNRLRHYSFGVNELGNEFVEFKELANNESFDYCSDRDLFEHTMDGWLASGRIFSDAALAAYIWERG